MWKQASAHLDQFHFPLAPLFATPVRQVLNYSRVDVPAFIEEGASLQDLRHLFLLPRYAQRLHRVAVTRAGRVVDVVSQSDLVRWAAQHQGSLPPSRREQAVGRLAGLLRTPLMVRLDSPFVDALELLYANRVSGLALVDGSFQLSGNLSASDLRGMSPLGFDFFLGSTLQFLAKATSSGAHPTRALGVGDTFGAALTLLSEEGLHRLYICDEGGHPVGLITLLDVIARL